MSEATGSLLNSAENLGTALVNSAKDGTLTTMVKGTLDSATQTLQGGIDQAASALQTLKPEDVTVEKLTGAFNKNGFNGIGAMAAMAGMEISADAVKAVYNKAADGQGIQAIYNHFFNKEKAKEATQEFNLMAALQSDDPMSTIGSMISGFFEEWDAKIPKFSEILANFGFNFDIGGIWNNLKASISGMIPGFSGGARETTVTTVSENETAPQGDTEQPVQTAQTSVKGPTSPHTSAEHFAQSSNPSVAEEQQTQTAEIKTPGVTPQNPLG